MFSPRNNRAGYQIIDDENNDDDEDTGPPTSFQPFSTDRSVTHSQSEAEPLVHEPTTPNNDLFGGPPLSHHISGDRNEISDMAKSQSSEGHWDHVENLDQFFTRVYEYHQGGGLMCIFLSYIFSLLQFIFVVSFSTFLLQCVDYPVLFNTKNVTASGSPIVGKRYISDAIVSNCMSQIHPLVTAALLFAILFWLFRVVRDGYHLLQFYEIHNFYEQALGISDKELSNLTWSEVDFQNYFVSMVNKDVLPPVLNIPFKGPIPYLPNGLKLNLEWLLFWGPWSPWEGPYALKDEYKHQMNITKLTADMEKTILYMGIANLVFSPLILMYQILYSFFSYAELVKREPGALGTRRYSNYGRHKIRHFNELGHELRLRLSRSHQAAEQYMDQFISPFNEIIAKNVAFVAGALFAVLALLSAWDEDVLSVDHVLTTMTVCGVVIVVCRSFIADENLIRQPEVLLNRVIAHIVYAPDSWIGQAHTVRAMRAFVMCNISAKVRQQFQYLFQLKATFILEELLSPLLTPFILIFWIRPQAREFVNFFHNFTISVDGLGDVCSFAQLDVSKHGDPTWNDGLEQDEQLQPSQCLELNVKEEQRRRMPSHLEFEQDERLRANDGKTELSLLHFFISNPDWNPPPGSMRFITQLRNWMDREMRNLREQTGTETNILAESMHAAFPLHYPPRLATAADRATSLSTIREDRNAAPLAGTNSLIGSLQQSGFLAQHSSSLHPSLTDEITTDIAAAEMSLTTMCLRRLRAEHDGSLRQTSNYGALATLNPNVLTDFDGESDEAAHLATVQTQMMTVTTATTVQSSISDIWGVPAQSTIIHRDPLGGALRRSTHQQQQLQPPHHAARRASPSGRHIDDNDDRPPDVFQSV
ncbi:unnamed protein product [Anisakis simplex]|uniref:Autophagy-related protein 9 n=1 Tax=Anisakis simplex TaxID=6269 RepID=A0A0M3K6F2_ANISI|nr:unnamed protein product [Anisakis simplex]